MNEKWMVRNERSILCAETTVRNHVVCVSGSVHWPPLKMKKKRRNSILFSRHTRFDSLFPTDLQLAIPIPQPSQLFWFFVPPSQLDKEEEEKRLSTTILLETTDRQTNRLADARAHTHTHTHTQENHVDPRVLLLLLRGFC